MLTIPKFQARSGVLNQQRATPKQCQNVGQEPAPLPITTASGGALQKIILGTIHQLNKQDNASKVHGHCLQNVRSSLSQRNTETTTAYAKMPRRKRDEPYT